MITKMKSIRFTIAAVVLLSGGLACGADLYLNDGLAYDIDYLIEGSLWIENATVRLYNPAQITGFAITGSGSVLDIFGGRIDYMLLVSTSNNGLPDGVVTIYGTDFAVNGIAVASDTPELFLANQTLTGVYEDGTPFTIVVDCAISGNATYIHYQTLKLGWIVSEPAIAVSQADYDFGQVDVGSSAWGSVTVSNMGNANLTVQSVAIVQDEPVQFDFTPLQVLPVTVEPGAAIDVEVCFTPCAEGFWEGVLQVESDDPNESVVSIRLTGTGLAVELTPSEQAQEMLDFAQTAFAAGTIEGAGKGKSAANKARTFYKMLKASKKLIDAGYYEYAIEVLNVAQKKCDGRKAPADFVKGSDVAVLNTMIKELIGSLKGQ